MAMTRPIAWPNTRHRAPVAPAEEGDDVDDALRPARGIVLGLGLSAVIWGALGALVAALL